MGPPVSCCVWTAVLHETMAVPQAPWLMAGWGTAAIPSSCCTRIAMQDLVFAQPVEMPPNIKVLQMSSKSHDLLSHDPHPELCRYDSLCRKADFTLHAPVEASV